MLATSTTVIGTWVVAGLVFVGLIALAVRLLRGPGGGGGGRDRATG